jgi:murein L,D-transpeptidase YafK
MKVDTLRSRLFAACLVAGASGWLAGCEDSLDSGSGRSLRPISPQTLAEMDKIGTTESAPVLIRTYKKEAELQIWKMKSDGQYALLKTFPMCRWSGQLGPKTHEGDRQVPEGFYTIAPNQMNPNSNYYLSFNVGYPNAYDKAWDRTGGNIMVHGVCSSAGCYSMTDAQIAEIYAIAREAFNGGQREIQMQSYPFKMTAENLAKHRLDPNIDFWMQLKNGADHFEVTKTEPSVIVCGKRYVFGAHADGDVSSRAPCPALHRDDEVEQQVAAKEAEDNAQVTQLVAKGTKAVRLVYEDGGQNPAFAGKDPDVSRPEALATGPQEIVLDGSSKSMPAVMKVANAASQSKPAKAAASATAEAAAPAADTTTVAANAAPVAAASSPSLVDGGKNLVKGWFKTGADTPPAVQVFEPEQPVPTDVPLPPRRAASADPTLRMAALPGGAAAKPAAATDADADGKTQ